MALQSNFLDYAADVVALDPDDYHQLIVNAASRGVVGGLLYDSVIAACAARAAAVTLVTLNERHFVALDQPGVAVVTPR